VKKSGRAARLESRLWGSYVDNEAVESGIVLWSDATSFKSLYEDTYLLLITQVQCCKKCLGFRVQGLVSLYEDTDLLLITQAQCCKR
jgi:hypothetical protein